MATVSPPRTRTQTPSGSRAEVHVPVGLERVIHWLLAGIEPDPATQARARTLVLGSWLGAGVALAFLLERLVAEPGFGPHHLTVLLASVLTALTPLVLKFTGRYDLSMYLLLVVVTGAVASDAYFYGGLGAASFIAIMILPLMGTLYGGTGVGAATTAVQVAVVIVFFALDLAEVPLPAPPDPDRQRMMLAAATIGVLSFVFILAVVFERERATAQSHKIMSDRRYAVAYTTSSDGLFEWVPGTGERFLSPPLERFVGRASPGGPPLQTEVHPEDLNEFTSALSTALTTPTRPFRVRLRYHTGAYRMVECRLLNVRDLDGQTRILGTVLDIEEAERLQRLKDQFLSVVSHELRTPLTSIRGSLAMLSSGAMGSMGEQALQFLAIAERNSKRLALLVDDLLDLQKLDAGQMEMAIRASPLSDVISDSVEAVAGQAEKRHVTIDVEDSDVHALADPRRLTQVVINLLSNAVKFSPEHSTVFVRVAKTDETAIVSIIDHGPGIPEEFRGRIFERFTQAQQASTRSVSGTGLGLAISHSIIHQHRGTIGFETEVGHGTTFWFQVPLPDAA